MTAVFQRNGRPRLALVGNAPLRNDLAERIDACDLVVRCNEAKTLGGYSGTRTDVLCITNTGVPARRIIAERSVRKEPRFPGLSEVWFPRDSGTHLRYLRASGSDIPESEFDDCSDDLLEANDLDGVRVTRFSEESNEQVFDRLRRESRRGFICPSTGFLALWHILERPEYVSFGKFLFGFTFKFWEGHPAAAERRIVEELCSTRDDLHFTPVSGGFFASLRRRFQRE